MEINKGNLRLYLLSKTNLINNRDPLEITELNRDNDPYVDGYVNFIFRVRQGGLSFIVKQARSYLLVREIASSLPENRNYLEYMSYRLRDGIVKDYVPKIYFLDEENDIFIMEDLGDMKLMRFELCRGRRFPFFSAQLGDFLAKSHFYTSELCLGRRVFRDMFSAFMNVDMRRIMEDLVLLRNDFSGESEPLSQAAADIWADPKIRLEIIDIRDVFIKKAECLVHGDLHTSNIFVDEYRMRVIDMEYSFMGPYGYDLGYLLANFTSQFSAYNYNGYPDAVSYQQYMLDTIVGVFDEYFKNFKECFDKDAKSVYRTTQGYIERLFAQILNDALRFMGAINMLRVLSLGNLPDFDYISDIDRRVAAKGLNLAIDAFFLQNSGRVRSTADIRTHILQVRDAYVRGLPS